VCHHLTKIRGLRAAQLQTRSQSQESGRNLDGAQCNPWLRAPAPWEATEDNREIKEGNGKLVGLGRLELPTSPLSGVRSSHLSYRPFQNRVAVAHNSFSLRCLSVIRNCVQILALRTRQQFLYHFPPLSVLKVRVAARDSQAGMSNLIFHEVVGHHIRLHVTDSTMPESVHPTGFYSQFFAGRERIDAWRFRESCRDVLRSGPIPSAREVRRLPSVQ
jgi:hypothetical protein